MRGVPRLRRREELRLSGFGTSLVVQWVRVCLAMSGGRGGDMDFIPSQGTKEKRASESKMAGQHP